MRLALRIIPTWLGKRVAIAPMNESVSDCRRGKDRNAAQRHPGARDNGAALRRTEDYVRACEVVMACYAGTFVKLEAAFVFVARAAERPRRLRILRAHAVGHLQPRDLRGHQPHLGIVRYGSRCVTPARYGEPSRRLLRARPCTRMSIAAVVWWLYRQAGEHTREVAPVL
jgi:hypothetical protein